MTSERWREVERLYHAALEREPAERMAYLDQVCAEPAHRREVESLIAAHEQGNSSFLEQSAAELELKNGTKLGSYEIVSPLGAGAMGEVYEARDTKLRRNVALKVLPSAFVHDPERMARFQQEARMLAALNHPNIATIHGLEQSGDFHFLIMELVPGETLAGRVSRGRAVPVEEALGIAKQIAEALEAAHEKGIIHRDLKPANVKVTPEGKVKVLDFGLAKAFAADTRGANAPTLSHAATEPGMILGTAAYMSPEQASGKPVDRRADIWAFGVVLWEMLSGNRLFDGETISHTLAAVLGAPIDFAKLPATTPAPIRELLKRCLDRDLRTRLQAIAEARIAISKYLAAPKSGTEAPLTETRATARRPWAAVGVPIFATLVLTALVFAILVFVFAMPGFRATFRAARTAPLVSANLIMDLAPAEMLGPTGSDNRSSRTSFAISPDDSIVVFVGVHDRTSMLYRRLLADPAAIAIPGTEGAEYPFFSPDGQWVGFAAANKLRKVALDGGPPIDLCDLTGRIAGASWGSAGVIVFADAGLWTVADSGGTPAMLVEGTQATVVSPIMLPDGKTVLFTERPSVSWEEAHVDSIRLATKQRKTRLTNATDARYIPTGYLVFIRNAALLGVPFDAARVEISGPPVPLLAGIMQATNAPDSREETGMGQFAVSPSGTLLYASGGIYPTPATTLVRVDRKGRETKLAGIKGALIGARLSPDGSRVAAVKTLDGTRATDLWAYDLPSGTPMRLTSTGVARWPQFSPDGKTITYTQVGSDPGIYSLPADGSGTPIRIVEPEKGAPGLTAALFSPDRKWLAYLQNVGDVMQLFVRPMPAPGASKQFAASTFNLTHAEFSPDGRWIAYVSDESGASEIYVQAFPGAGEKHRISSNGGSQPVWSRNGRELFYLQTASSSPNIRNAMVVVEISNAGGFRAGAPHILFDGPYTTSAPLRGYDVASDGQFIMVRKEGNPPDQKVTQLNVVLGWGEELKRRVPSATPAR